MKVLSALQFIIITCFIFFSQTRSQAVQSSFPVTNGNVYAIASSGSTVFLGGNFTYISPYSGNGVAINTATGNVINTFPTVTTPSTGITSVVPDGAGGFYIGGNFTQINGTSRTYIARLNSDGSLNAWNPVLNGSVSAIDISSDNNTIYVAGGFTQVNSTTRNHLAALSAADGSLTSWNPGLSGGNINAISLSTSGTIYVVGSFTSSSGAIIGDSSRRRAAEISLTTGKATAWDPNVSSSFTEVLTVTQSASSVYIGGDFTQVNGSVTRNYAAKISKSSGIVDASWNPNPGYIVNALIVSGDKVYAGGKFSSIGGKSRWKLAVLDTGTGTALDGWVPDPNGDVKSLLMSGSTLYVGGDFETFNGSARARLAAVDISSLASVGLTSLNYGFGSTVNALSVSGSALYAGGIFTTAGGQMRNGLAAVNGTTGEILSWNPNPSSPSINSIVPTSDGNDLFVGGGFSSIGGQSRNNLAKINVATGNADAVWDPNVNGIVQKMSRSTGDTLYFYGYDFTTVNGSVSRPGHIAAVKGTGTGEVTAFNPDGFTPITTRYIQVSPEGSTVYLGYNSQGVFWSSLSRNYFVALNTSDGSATDMDPVFNQGVFCSAINGNTIYFGGQFTSIDGNTDIQKIAKYDASGGWSNPTLVTTWNNTADTRPDGDIRALLYSSSGSEPTLYFGGSLFAVGAASRDHYAAIKASDASVQSWNINAVNSGGALDVRMHLSVVNQKIYIADYMESVLASPRNYLAAVDGGSDPLPVELVSFTVSKNENSAFLRWTTATEVNNHGFEVERKNVSSFRSQVSGGNSTSLKHETSNDLWARIAFVEGAGDSNSPREYSYSDRSLSAGTYSFRLKQIDRDGKLEYSKEVEVSNASAPAKFELLQNYPNPFNPNTMISFTLQVSGMTTLKVYDAIGREVAILVNEYLEAGAYYQRTFDASYLSSGTFFVRLANGERTQVKKLMLMK